MLLDALDRTLDFAVAPGYSRAGYLLRKRSFAPLPRMDGRTVLVTGGTSGIGRAAAERFAALGARVLVLARNPDRGQTAVAEIVAKTQNEDVGLIVGDLASQASLRTAAQKVEDDVGALHVLVNNAGVMSRTRELSPDGIELTFATNVVGPYLLTELLKPLLLASAPARIVNVTSGGMFAQKLDLADPQSAQRDYDGTGAYARSKRAEMVLTDAWARQLDGTGVVVHAMHPGWADTPGVQEDLPRFARIMGPALRTPEEGADTIVWLGAAAEPAHSTGRLWHDRKARAEHRIPTTKGRPGDGERLIALCESLTSPPE